MIMSATAPNTSSVLVVVPSRIVPIADLNVDVVFAVTPRLQYSNAVFAASVKLSAATVK